MLCIELRDKRKLKKLQFWPKTLGAMLEYWDIEHWSIGNCTDITILFLKKHSMLHIMYNSLLNDWPEMSSGLFLSHSLGSKL